MKLSRLRAFANVFWFLEIVVFFTPNFELKTESVTENEGVTLGEGLRANKQTIP